MKKTRRKGSVGSRLFSVLLLLLVLALGCVLLLRNRGSEISSPSEEEPRTSGAESASPSPAAPAPPSPAAPAPPSPAAPAPPSPAAPAPPSPAAPTDSPNPVLPPASEVQPSPGPAEETPLPLETEEREAEYHPIVYDETSYRLVTDMVYAYKVQLKDRDAVIAAAVEALTEYEPRLGEAWGKIMAYWDYANNGMEIRHDRLPEDLPTDDSLCIVVLGFKLNSDGTMSEELQGRCELGLIAAQQYPQAFIVVTGGGTAPRHPEITEAGAMKDWFCQHGVEESRIIPEDRSNTTEQNASNTLAILTEEYPQVKQLVIVSSDYHLPLGCLMFTEAALLYRCEYGVLPFEVVGNLGYPAQPLPQYLNPSEQQLYVWVLADPKL